MPVNGLVASWPSFELKVASSASGSHSGDGSGVYGHSASGYTRSTPDTTTLSTGFSFTVSGSSATDQWSVTYVGPGAPLGVTWTGSGWSSVEATVVISDLKVYNTGTYWYLTGSYEVFANGVSKLTGSLTESGGGLGPCYVPLVGVPLYLSGSASASTTGLPSYGDTSTYDYTSSCSATASGGWRFKDDSGGSWQALAVTPYAGAPGGSCAITATLPTISASDTYSLSIESYAYGRHKRSFVAEEPLYVDVVAICTPITEDPPYTACEDTVRGTCPDGSDAVWDIYLVEAWTESRTGSVEALPDLEKAIKRFNPDFAALLYRSKMPQVLASLSNVCTIDGVETSTTSTPEVYPYQDTILQVVTNGAAAMEDTLGYTTYAPVEKGASKTYTKTYEWFSCAALDCPPAGYECTGCSGLVTYSCTPIEPTYDDYSASNTLSVVFPSSVGTDLAGYLGHSSAIARFHNTWPSPHWSYFLWNQSWDVDSSPETWDDYWAKVGSQYLYNSPAGITRNTRNHLVSEGLANDGNATFGDSYLGGLRWAGVSRWLTKSDTPVTSFPYDSSSSSLWNASDATLTHGTDITVNPSALTCEVTLDLGSFTVDPYLWPHLADLFTLDWETTNVVSIKGYLEGSDGSRVLLNDNDPGVAKSRPQGSATKYLGSWAYDFGADGVTDQGTDDLGTGESSTFVADAHRSFAPQLLSGWTAKKLVFVIEVSDVDADVTLHYPTLEYTKSASRMLTWEFAHQCNVVHPDGPGVRFGMWDTGTSGTVNNPPACYDGFTRANAVDWRIMRNLTVKKAAYNDNLTTELTTDRDTFEGQSVGEERNNSHGFLLPVTNADWKFAIVSSLAEVPPLACFPFRKRDETTWEADGDFAQVVWMWAQEPDKFVNARAQAELYYSSTLWTTGATGVSGWYVNQHSHAVDNTESGAKVKVSITDYATVRPWRGTFSLLPPGASGGVTYVAGRDGMHYRTYVGPSGYLVSERADNLLGWGGETTAIQGDRLHLSHSASGYPLLTLLYNDSGDVKMVQSSDGVSWGMATTISSGSGNKYSCSAPVDGGRTFRYWVDSSGDIYGTEYDAGNNTVGTTGFSTGISGVDDVQIDAWGSMYGEGRFRVVLQCTVSGVVTQYTSTDGRTFS